MKSRTSSVPLLKANPNEALTGLKNTSEKAVAPLSNIRQANEKQTVRSQILFITSYPPRECGIATYSEDLIKALNNKFSKSLSIKVCALETGELSYTYPAEVKYTLNTSTIASFEKLAGEINNDEAVKTVLIQHEFGFYQEQEQAFLQFIYTLSKPVAIVFHTVLPKPDEQLKAKVKSIADVCQFIVVMTNTSKKILTADYDLPQEKVLVIAHGTHLVSHPSKKSLKLKYGLKDRSVLTTFGLLGSGKSIETTLEALPAIIKAKPNVMFLVIGKTHPEVVKHEGEKYREMLEQKVKEYSLQDNVRFINSYVPLPELLEYLQLTDIYLFTTNDPNQAVSGTFVYAMSCGCPIISTPIPHAKEVLTKDTGIIFDFRDSKQLAHAVTRLLKNDKLRKNISTNTLQKIVFTAWENSAVAHAMLFERLADGKIEIQYNLPEIKLNHLAKMTTGFGIVQFAKKNQPDIDTGYTLDDNARALITMCMHYELTHDKKDLAPIRKYLQVISVCLQPDGTLLNYMDEDRKFTDQNNEVNLDDSNGRAVWAIGYLISLSYLLPSEITKKAEILIEKIKPALISIYSTRAMAFAVKGLCSYQSTNKLFDTLFLIETFADRLVQMYKHESSEEWQWFEGSLTYANSIMPEALLEAWKLTGNAGYKYIAQTSFDFLLSQIFNKNGIEVISNRTWKIRGKEAGNFGEQPIDVAYTIMALSKFYDEFQLDDYREKMEIAFNWFLGKNRLNQIIYNPCTGGCYDGLEEFNVNLNQGAESTVSYLMARLTVQKYENATDNVIKQA